MKNIKTELLAPAGNAEAFRGAVNAGADAVYLGGARFGARAYADNFTTEELIACIRYAHIFGRKVYLTVNTLMKDAEIAELYDYLKPFYEAGLDAVIVQDLGVFEYIKAHFPDMELHVSTQMTITGAFGGEMLKEMGASRIVPARELSLKEIVALKEKTGLEMETFIHGAMCYCYSGQCLFSSILGGRSGNRGRCAQPCRLPYTVDIPGTGAHADGKYSEKHHSGEKHSEKKNSEIKHLDGIHLEECYPLSLKDMCTIEHIGDFMDAGIDSFKIEGRMKKPEYAAGVTAIYRKYIDRKLKNPSKPVQVDQKDLEALSRLYIRSERQDGYYYKHNGRDMVTLDSSAYSGSDEKLLEDIRKQYIETSLKKPISMYASFYCGNEVSITCICGQSSVTVTGEVLQPAKNQPLTQETIDKQLRKLGDTCFEAEEIEISTDGNGFYPVKSLNELRRKAVRELEDAIIEAYGLLAKRQAEENSEKAAEIPKAVFPETAVHGWSVSVTTLEQLEAVRSFLKEENGLQLSRIYLESEILLNYPGISLSGLREAPGTEESCEIYIALPYILRKRDYRTMEQLLSFVCENSAIHGFLIRNLEEYQFLINRKYTGRIITDAGVYVWNEESYTFWKDRVDLMTCPLELKNHEWQKVFARRAVEKIVYGRLPMMITANCVAKTAGKCYRGKDTAAGGNTAANENAAADKYAAVNENAAAGEYAAVNGNAASSAKIPGTSVVYLTDRYRKKFPVLTQCRFCTNVILNSVTLSLHSRECRKWYDAVSKRISLTIESAGETIKILKFFAAVGRGQTPEPPYEEYTTGHEKRGVE